MEVDIQTWEFSALGSLKSQHIWSPNYEKSPLRGWGFKDCSSGLPFTIPGQLQTDIILNLWLNCSSGFMLMLFVLSCKTWSVAKAGDTFRSSTISRFLPHLIHGARSLALREGSYSVNSQSGQCPSRLEARSEACSALSLKPKQDYLFNFPSNSLNINWLYVILQALFCREICVWFSFFWISSCFTPFNKFIHFSSVSWVNSTLMYILRCLLCASTHCLLTRLSLKGSVSIM